MWRYHAASFSGRGPPPPPPHRFHGGGVNETECLRPWPLDGDLVADADTKQAISFSSRSTPTLSEVPSRNTPREICPAPAIASRPCDY